MGQSIYEDTTTPINAPLSAKYKRSFAYPTFKDRIPVILTKVIDYLVRDKEVTIAHFGEKARNEVKSVIGYISQLKNELQTDKPFTPVSPIGPDHKIWNKILCEKSKENSTPTWFQTEWLYAENYLYRRLHEAFLLTDSIRHLDPFHWQKIEAFDSAIMQIEILAEHMNNLTSSRCESPSEIETAFTQFLKLSLWGNKCDLSLSAGTSVSHKENPLSQVTQFDSNILADDSKEIWNTISSGCNGTVDIVLDNASYELFTDLCLAEFIITKCNASKVQFRPKVYPWYVSDVLVKDVHYMLNTLKEKKEPFSECSERWQRLFNEGKFKIVEDTFWTTPHSYDEMERIDPNLYSDLKKSKLVIFKGDLNYRKLVGDINWPPTASFKSCLRGFLPAPVVTLRTLKADTICGLAPGKAEEAEAKLKDWLITGDFAVIQFASERNKC